MRAKGKTTETSAAPATRSKRQQIVDAAITVFLEHGYTATTFQMVAEEANVIRATIYSHFKDKEELFVAVIEELTVNKLSGRMEGEVRALTPIQFVDFLASFMAEQKQDDQYKGLLRMVIGESQRFPEIAQMYFNTVFSKGMSNCVRYFEGHPEVGLDNSFAAACVVGGSMMSVIIHQEILGGKNVAPIEIADVAKTLKTMLTACENETKRNT